MLLLSEKNTELLIIPETLSTSPYDTYNLLAKAGYRLAPAHPNNSPYYRSPDHSHRLHSIGKIPATTRWQQTHPHQPPLPQYFNTAPNPETQTNALLILDPDTLIIDIDVKNGAPGLASFDILAQDSQIQNLFDLSSFIVKTPSGGYHLYFSLPPHANTPTLYIHKKNPRYKGIDFLSSRLHPNKHTTIGAYSVAPHSSTPSGTYTILPFKNRISPLNPLPPQVLALIQRAAAPSHDDMAALMQSDDSDHTQSEPVVWDDTEPNIERATQAAIRFPALQQGDRSHGMFRAAALMRDNLISPLQATNILNTHLNPRCEPPLEWTEFFDIVKNAYHYAKGKPGSKHPKHIFVSPFIQQLQEQAMRESLIQASIPAPQAQAQALEHPALPPFLMPKLTPIAPPPTPAPANSVSISDSKPIADPTPSQPTQHSQQAWMEELDLTIDKSGATRPKNGSFKNAALLIQNLPELKNMLAYNQLTQKVVITRPSPWMHIIRPDAQFIHDDFRSQPWDDHDTIQLKGLLERYPLHQVSPTWGTGFTIATPTLIEAIQYVADQNPFHPVRRLLRDAQSKWDGTPRLDTWIPDYLLAENTPLNQGISRLLIMAIIMRQFNPGHKYDHMVVWEGEQGIGKSQIGRILALHPEWFSDSAFDMSKADKVLEAIEGKLVVEMAELDQLGKFAITTVKSFLTQQYDRARRAWARTVSDNGRQTVFVGTTNESQYLIDVVNRRFLPVLIPNTRLRLDELKRDILQIYGEAMYQFDEIVTAQENAKQPLSEYKMELPEHLHLAAKTEQASRVVLDHRTGMLKEFLDDPKAARSATMYIDPTTNAITALTARDVAVGMMMLAPSKIDRRVQMDISTMFKQIGWKHKQVTDKKGSRHWFYIRPEHPAPFATESESVSPFENKA